MYQVTTGMLLSYDLNRVGDKLDSPENNETFADTRGPSRAGWQPSGTLVSRGSFDSSRLSSPLAIPWLCLSVVGFAIGLAGFQMTAGMAPSHSGLPLRSQLQAQRRGRTLPIEPISFPPKGSEWLCLGHVMAPCLVEMFHSDWPARVPCPTSASKPRGCEGQEEPSGGPSLLLQGPHTPGFQKCPSVARVCPSPASPGCPHGQEEQGQGGGE